MPKPTKPGPWSEWKQDTVGENAQRNYKFLEALWDISRNPPLRDELFKYDSEAHLRSYLSENWSIDVPSDVRIMVVDIESARTRSYINDPNKDTFYVLVLPPALRRQTHDKDKADYREAQASAGAWYHATSDGYGM